MTPSKKKIGEILLEAGLITEFQLNTALNEQKRWGGKVVEKLVQLGFITEDIMLDVLREQLKTPTINLQKVRIPDEIISMLPAEIIRKHHALPTGTKTINNREYLIVAMNDPTNLRAIDEIQFSTKLKIMPALAGPITLERAIRYYLDKQGDLFALSNQNDSLYAPTKLRDRVDITDGSRTVIGERLADQSNPQHARKAPPAPGAAPKEAVKLDAGEDLVQLRTELHALRDLLIEKGIIDRRSLIEKVARSKGKG